MIVAEQKPLKDIQRMLKGKKKVLTVGCGTCVSVCFAGGKKESQWLQHYVQRLPWKARNSKSRK